MFRTSPKVRGDEDGYDAGEVTTKDEDEGEGRRGREKDDGKNDVCYRNLVYLMNTTYLQAI